MLDLKGVTKAGYFHFLCAKCGSTVTSELGTDGLVPTITSTCATCKETGKLKFWQTTP